MTSCGCFKNPKDSVNEKRRHPKPISKQLKSDYSSKNVSTNQNQLSFNYEQDQSLMHSGVPGSLRATMKTENMDSHDV
jgi:hypothetical protein